MGLFEAIVRRPSLITAFRMNRMARDVQRRPTVYFPTDKHDFSREVVGKNRFDLANAFGQRAIGPGDVLALTVAQNGVRSIPVRAVYLEPLSLSDKHACGHRFLPEKPDGQLTTPFTLRRITSWKKVGHVTPQRWREQQ